MKKIMFNDRYGLTDAVLQGAKTVTRRVTQQTLCLDDACRCGHDKFKIVGEKLRCYTDGGSWIEFNLPYQVGEIVAVAQSYKNTGYAEDKIFYRYIKEHDGYLPEPASKDKGWTNKMFVCADLMPHQIRIIDIRAERLQDITEEDCLREGVEVSKSKQIGLRDMYCFPNALNQATKVGWCNCYHTPKEAFALLIDKISGKGTWENNPFVWRIEFELVK